MTIKTLILGGVATAALTGAAWIAPVGAYTRHPGTPAEHRQTEDLNQQELNKVQAQEQATQQASAAPTNQQAYAQQGASAEPSAAPTPSPNPQSGAQSEESQNLASSSASAQSSPQTGPQTGDQMTSANGDMGSQSNPSASSAQSGDEMASAKGESVAQAGTTSASPEAGASSTVQTGASSADRSMSANASGADKTPVDSLANPPQALANASVETSNGQAVGAVQRVITDASGKAKAVVVSLLGRVNKLVEIAANQLSFDESRNVVVAELSADEINALPPAPQS